MLVLSRKKNESIVINNDITIVVVEIRGDKVRLGVEDPRKCPCIAARFTTLSAATSLPKAKRLPARQTPTAKSATPKLAGGEALQPSVAFCSAAIHLDSSFPNGAALVDGLF